MTGAGEIDQRLTSHPPAGADGWAYWPHYLPLNNDGRRSNPPCSQEVYSPARDIKEECGILLRLEAFMPESALPARFAGAEILQGEQTDDAEVHTAEGSGDDCSDNY